MKILAFDIGGTDIKYGILDENLNIIEKYKAPTEAQNGGKALTEKVCAIAKEFKGIDCIGVSTAGQVNSNEGKIIFATDNIPGYTGIEVAKMLKEATGVPAFADNDVNCAAMGEYIKGAAKNNENFVCLTYGTGIGGAAVINGEVYRGSSFAAGEMGHIITHANGKECTCGLKGCYEAYASAKALIKNVYDITGENLNGMEIFAPENFKREEIKSAIDLWINEIAFGLISIIHIFNPSLVVLGGGIMNENYIVDKINEIVKSQIMPAFADITIKKAALKNSAGITGGAYLALKALKGEKA